ncbi:hypothetical protein KCM76_20010 [Zooshikella marina]|uniref:hypothetical protein n=1 Tax=Zooshikella ganghwensis TaxID=202772 RepID=UPI001BB0D120|nr:hypothetical protein [Zooshikella ganghwensis]MBU2708287.1 hypothetical protein [Zooshikella ganghwensis]
MFVWQKLGRIFDPQTVYTLYWLKHFAQSPTLLKLGDRFRIFFSSRPDPDEFGNFVSYTGYLDLNKHDFFDIQCISAEPVLSLGKLGCFDEFGIYPACIVGHDNRYWLFYAGWTRCEAVPFNAAIGLAVSDDGQHFERLGDGPIISYSIDEPFVIGSPRVRIFNHQWYMWYSAGVEWLPASLQCSRPEPIYKIRMAVSDDGINWLKQGKPVIPDILDEHECQASADVTFFEGLYHMFFSYRYTTNFKNAARGYRIGYAYSANLYDWTRDDSKAGIKPSTTGWDAESVSYPHIFEHDNTLYMLYQGNGIGKTGFGLARLIDYKALK